MNIELRPEFSTCNPDDVPAFAARGDYMEDSLIGKSIHDVLKGVRDDSEKYCPEESLRTIHKRLISRGHFGPYEHPQAFFVAEGVSRVTMAQITRHRHISFDVQSMRYCNFEGAEPEIPPSFVDTGSNRHYADENGEEASWETVMKIHWMKCVDKYTDAIESGVPKEDARFFFPLGTKVNMAFSANPRTLMHLIDMRHAGDAQGGAQEFAKQVLDEAQEWAPVTFEMYKKHAKGASKKAP